MLREEGSSEVVDKTGCGIAVAERSAESVALGVESLLKEGNDDMLERGKQAVSSIYNWEAVTERVLSAL